ncbi:MAG TPA: M13 family metallopeptidase, partial [Polyangia bacterium]
MSNGINEAAMDPAISPCDDFYKYACGGYLKTATIPSTEGGVWLNFSPILEKARKLQRELLETLAAGQVVPGARQGEAVGTYYRSCTEFGKHAAAGEAEMIATLKRVDAVTSIAALFDFVAEQQTGLGWSNLFVLNIGTDEADSTRNALRLSQGGFELEDSATYTATDPDASATRQAYRQFIASLFSLAGSGAAGAQSGNRGYFVESQLARGALTQEELNADEPRYVPKTLAELKTLAPTIPWDAYFRKMGLSNVARVVLDAPGFLQNLEILLRSVSLSDWRDYLRMRVLIDYSSYVSPRFFDAWFKFYGTFRNGAQMPAERPEWCVDEVTASSLVDGLAEPFVARVLSPEARARALAMAKTIGQVMTTELENNTWLDTATRSAALKKMAAMAYGIGHPEQWRDLSTYKLDANASFVSNNIAVSRSRWAQLVKTLDQPVDRHTWRAASPIDVNAFYIPTNNQMLVTGGYLQSPNFDRTFIDAANFGATGATIGHEITHAFDSGGRFYGATGNLEMWFSSASTRAFDQRAQCLTNQFNGYTAYGTTRVNGQQTLPENIADLGGLKIAYKAFKTVTAGKPAQATGTKLTDDQIFFVSYAQSFCSKWTDEFLERVV